MPRRATVHNNRDANEETIKQAFSDMLVDWDEAGPLDGWVFIGKWIPVEIKNPDGKRKPGQKGEFRESQVRFITKCKRNGWPWLVIHTQQDVIDSVNALRKSQR